MNARQLRRKAFMCVRRAEIGQLSHALAEALREREEP